MTLVIRKLSASEAAATRWAAMRAPTTEAGREAQRRYNQANPDKVRAWGRKFAAEYPAEMRAMRRAHRAVWRAIRKGALVRPLVCEECGKPARQVVEAAHLDYSRPLDVRWLCRSCHLRFDRSDPKTKGMTP